MDYQKMKTDIIGELCKAETEYDLLLIKAFALHEKGGLPISDQSELLNLKIKINQLKIELNKF